MGQNWYENPCDLKSFSLCPAFSRISDGTAIAEALQLKYCVYEPKEADIAIKKTEQNTINKRTMTKKL